MVSWGEFRPGTSIKEEAVAKLLGVSRTPVRAALFALDDLGLIEKSAGGSYALRRFSELEVHEAVEIRVALESLAAKWLAERGCSSLELDELTRLLGRLLEAEAQERGRGEITECMRLSFDFFSLLARRSHSRQIQEHFERINALPFIGLHGFRFRLMDGLQSDFALFLQDHRKLLDAIRARDPSAAESVARNRSAPLFAIIMQVYRSPERDRLPGADMIEAR